MDTWSNFEQRQKKEKSRDTRKNNTNIGIDALYVSSSSSNIAPASATLLRHAGLNAPNTNSSKDGTANDGGDVLRFHWMRPHPSLAFSLEEGEGGDSANADNIKQKSSSNNTQSNNPAVEASKLMDAYRTSQINKQLDNTKEDGDDNNTSDDINTKTKSSNIPLELPKLRINLASLVEPPLMSSWLPGDDDSEE